MWLRDVNMDICNVYIFNVKILFPCSWEVFPFLRVTCRPRNCTNLHFSICYKPERRQTACRPQSSRPNSTVLPFRHAKFGVTDDTLTVSTLTLFRYVNILGGFSVTILFSWSWTQNHSLALFTTVFALPQRWPQPICLPRIAHHDLRLYVQNASMFIKLIFWQQNIFYEGAGIE
jgi:hypothetical protein